LSNAEEIKNALGDAVYDLKESEQPILQLIKQMISRLHGFSSINKDLSQLVDRLQSSQIELQDIAHELETLNDAVNYDEQRINFINERLMLGYRLQKKHGVKSTSELLALKDELERKLQAVLSIDEAISSTEKKFSDQKSQLEKIANELSARRSKAIPPFEKNVNSLLHKVGMPNAAIKVSLTRSDLNSYGGDTIEFLFDANLPATGAKSSHWEPLKKIASGGELSRLMLCIKSLVAEKINLPTLIFDEIDTGISGEAAKQVGIILKQISAQRQVISITHQPQIAGKADTHFYVYKQVKNDAIQTQIRLLKKDERIQAIAQMLAGEPPTAAAIKNAKEMIASSLS
jgi:DNA repair protein RecN (Recombination protein N)